MVAIYRPQGETQVAHAVEALVALVSPSESDFSAAQELLRKRKVLDVLLQAGSISAKISEDGGGFQRIEIGLRQFEDNAWSAVFDGLSTSAYSLALLLAGKISLELVEIFSAQDAALFPEHAQDLQVRVRGVACTTITPQVLAVLLHVFERIDGDPFSLFLLRGCGRDEFLLEVRRRRAQHASQIPLSEEEQESSLEQEEIRTQELLARFWSMGKKVEKLSYTIRADELPASILRRLDPLPLGGLETQIDHRLEEAYERVARLAQSYGLGF